MQCRWTETNEFSICRHVILSETISCIMAMACLVSSSPVVDHQQEAGAEDDEEAEVMGSGSGCGDGGGMFLCNLQERVPVSSITGGGTSRIKCFFFWKCKFTNRDKQKFIAPTF